MSQVWRVMDTIAWTGAAGLAHAIPVIMCGLFTCHSDQHRIDLAPGTGQCGCSALPVTRVLVPVAARSCVAAAGGAASRAFILGLVPAVQGRLGWL
jgi:hypothetical protein